MYNFERVQQRILKRYEDGEPITTRDMVLWKMAKKATKPSLFKKVVANLQPVVSAVKGWIQ